MKHISQKMEHMEEYSIEYSTNEQQLIYEVIFGIFCTLDPGPTNHGCLFLEFYWYFRELPEDALRTIGLYLTLDQEVVFSASRITDLSIRVWSSRKSISFYLPGLLDQELNPSPGDTKPILYH